MPHFYFHLFNDETILDQEGVDLPDKAVAIEKACKAAREMAAESVREGRLVLDHRIDVADDSGATVATIRFRDAVQVEGSDQDSG